MKTTLIGIVCMLLTSNVNAQTKNYAIKLYNLSTYEQYQVKYSQPNIQTTANSNLLNLLHPTIGLQWNNRKKRIREIELTNFSIQHLDNVTKSHLDSTNQTITADGDKNTRIHIGLRFEQMFVLSKKEDAKLQVKLGFGFNPYYIQNHIVPYVSSNYVQNTTDIGIRAFFIPRLTYNVSSRLFLDVNVPICVAAVYMEAQKVFDPTIRNQLQKNMTYNFDAMPSFFSGRIGLGVRL